MAKAPDSIEDLSIILVRAHDRLKMRVSQGLVFLVVAIENTLECERDHDDDDPECIDCEHGGLCDAAEPFRFLLKEKE